MIRVQPSGLKMCAQVKWDHVGAPLSVETKRILGYALAVFIQEELRIYDGGLMK